MHNSRQFGPHSRDPPCSDPFVSLSLGSGFYALVVHDVGRKDVRCGEAWLGEGHSRQPAGMSSTWPLCENPVLQGGCL